jgi:hypothetical protein
VAGNSGIDRTLSWACVQIRRRLAVAQLGKHFLIELPGCALRIHFLMFGICRIEECWNSLLRSFTLAQSIPKPNIRYRKS